MDLGSSYSTSFPRFAFTSARIYEEWEENREMSASSYLYGIYRQNFLFEASEVEFIVTRRIALFEYQFNPSCIYLHAVQCTSISVEYDISQLTRWKWKKLNLIEENLIILYKILDMNFGYNLYNFYIIYIILYNFYIIIKY